MVVYGFLSYNDGVLRIPNHELMEKFQQVLSRDSMGEVKQIVETSKKMLEATLAMDEQTVAHILEEVHDREIPFLVYNDENALSYTISLALYAARNFYTVHREWAGGKGFADLVFLPRKRFPEKPALVVELKWDQSAAGALEQIKRNEYCKSLSEYHGNLLLVGINYNKKTKEHECIIEENRK